MILLRIWELLRNIDGYIKVVPLSAFSHLTAEPGATKICSFVDSCHLSEENFGASKLPLALTNCFSKLASFLNDYFLPLP